MKYKYEPFNSVALVERIEHIAQSLERIAAALERMAPNNRLLAENKTPNKESIL